MANDVAKIFPYRDTAGRLMGRAKLTGANGGVSMFYPFRNAAGQLMFRGANSQGDIVKGSPYRDIDGRLMARTVGQAAAGCSEVQLTFTLICHWPGPTGGFAPPGYTPYQPLRINLETAAWTGTVEGHDLNQCNGTYSLEWQVGVGWTATCVNGMWWRYQHAVFGVSAPPYYNQRGDVLGLYTPAGTRVARFWHSDSPWRWAYAPTAVFYFDDDTWSVPFEHGSIAFTGPNPNPCDVAAITWDALVIPETLNVVVSGGTGSYASKNGTYEINYSSLSHAYSGKWGADPFHYIQFTPYWCWEEIDGWNFWELTLSRFCQNLYNLKWRLDDTESGEPPGISPVGQTLTWSPMNRDNCEPGAPTITITAP